MQVTPGDLKNTLELCFKQDKTYAVVAWPLFENPSSITSDYFYLHICMYFLQVMLLMCGVNIFVFLCAIHKNSFFLFSRFKNRGKKEKVLQTRKFITKFK